MCPFVTEHVINALTAVRSLKRKAPARFPAGAIPTVDFLLYHLVGLVKKVRVKSHDSIRERLIVGGKPGGGTENFGATATMKAPASDAPDL